MKRSRPYIPIKVRCIVLERMAEAAEVDWQSLYEDAGDISAEGNFKNRVRTLLVAMFPDGAQLDHDPALVLRKFNARSGRYTPDANDPDYLIYRRKEDHQQKTTGRKPGALRTVTTKGSDIGIKTKFARLERKKTKPPARRIYSDRKIASRPFQKGRKLHGKPTN